MQLITFKPKDAILTDLLVTHLLELMLLQTAHQNFKFVAAIAINTIKCFMNRFFKLLNIEETTKKYYLKHKKYAHVLSTFKTVNTKVQLQLRI